MILMAAAVFVGVYHNRRVAAGESDPVTSAVRTVTAPIVGLLRGMREWGGSTWAGLFRGRAVQEENAHLKARLTQLEFENARLREEAADLPRLRAQLGFPPEVPAARIAATVLARRPGTLSHTLVLNRGTNHGVRLRAVVVAPEGLVGYVADVAPTTCSVLLLTDAGAAVGARLQRPDSRATGVARGTGSAQLNFVFVDRPAEVRVGDRVVSSGLGGEKGVFIKGLPVGTVARIGGTDAAPQILIAPAVDFDRLEEVYILR
jgi:rod shape-determining protein MreC